MPFKSKAQQRWMFANKPRMAKRWAKETKDIKALPEKVSEIEKNAFWKSFEKCSAPKWVKNFDKIKNSSRLDDFIYNMTKGYAEPFSDLEKFRKKGNSLGFKNLANDELLSSIKTFSRGESLPHPNVYTALETLMAGAGNIVSEKKNNSYVYQLLNDGALEKSLRAVKPLKDIDPESTVEITHAGSMQFIKDFLSGKNKGYSLERGGLGLQVHPLIGKISEPELTRRNQFYSNRATTSMGGTPAVMKAKIKAKHLQAAPNVYEAGLPFSSLKHLEDVKLDELPLEKTAFWKVFSKVAEFGDGGSGFTGTGKGSISGSLDYVEKDGPVHRSRPGGDDTQVIKEIRDRVRGPREFSPFATGDVLEDESIPHIKY